MTIQSPSVAPGHLAPEQADPDVHTHAPAPAAHPAAAPDSDESLLARFLRGDRPALGLLAQRYEAPMLGLAMGLLGRRDLALDAVQDTWLRVIKYGRSFKSGSTVKTWLYRILINTCKDTRTARLRFPTTNPERERAGEPTSTSASSTHADSVPLPQLRQAIDSLTGDQKLLVLLCYHHGLTHPQAADVLNIPTGTLKSRLHTALNHLRTQLQHPERKRGVSSSASAPPAPSAAPPSPPSRPKA